MPLTRRHLVRAGLAVALPAVAGCSASTPEAIRDFRASITDELDVDIQSLSVREGVVRLAYDSAHQTDTRDWGYEIGFIAGRYGAFVERGWKMRRLEATVTGTGGTTVTWHVDSGTALAHANDSMDTGTFVSRILSTVEVQ